MYGRPERYLSSRVLPVISGPTEFKNTSSGQRSPTMPLARAPWAWVWALTSPGISKQSLASTTVAESEPACRR